jgi:hypothetical protein
MSRTLASRARFRTPNCSLSTSSNIVTPNPGCPGLGLKCFQRSDHH